MNRTSMAKRAVKAKAATYAKQCFAELLSRDPELSALRAEYALAPSAKRRAAAEWAYEEKAAQLAPVTYDLPANSLERLRQLRRKAQS